MIPKNNPPTLEGHHSKPFKEFVEACLNKDPRFVSIAAHLSIWVMVGRGQKFLQQEGARIPERERIAELTGWLRELGRTSS